MKRRIVLAAAVLMAAALGAGLWFFRGISPLNAGDTRMNAEDSVTAYGQLEADGTLRIEQTFYLTNRTGAALEEIVETNNKQRYSFSSDKRLIRANQGHSIPVDVELPVTSPPDTLWHGTADRFVPSIMEKGILRMSRLYVHLSPDEETARIVGRRHGKPVILRVDAGQMEADGYVFYLSANGVWLTTEVPVKYITVEKNRD